MEVCVSGFQCFVQIFPASSVVVLVMHLSKSRIIKYCEMFIWLCIVLCIFGGKQLLPNQVHVHREMSCIYI